MRKIIHVDMDCFFAAVEMRDNPSLVGKPVAVGGSPSQRGVISTANYEARKYGVRSALSSAQALKLCPNLVLLRGRYLAYRKAAEQIREVFHRYTDLVEPLSLDEAYLDVTDSDLPQGSATFLAQRIRSEIYQATGLTASAGIAPNKLLAKLASERNKPNGQCTIAPEEIPRFMADLPLGKLHGVGPVTTSRLKEEGFQTCKDLLAFSRFELVHRLGSLGDWLYDACRGIDEREVSSEWERKSLSVEETFPRDLEDPDIMRAELARLWEELESDLTKHQDREIKGLVVKIKFYDFKQTTIERGNLPLNVDSVHRLFSARWETEPRPVRLLGVGVRFAEETEENLQLSFAVQAS